ncbi:MAG: molybdopterin-binding protein [Paracoccaceae bacterium]|nr:molybdopterin-binding protein [Paracoccaceae bacterium]
MEFGPVPLSQAEGAILAHSETLPGGRLRKGRVLTADDVARLAETGVAEVTVARLGSGDVHEDPAASAVAAALVPNPERAGLRLGPAATGRVNLFSDVVGVAEIDRAAIDAANRVDPGITIATVPQWQRMAQGGMVATVKIIPYAVSRDALDRAVAAAVAAIAMRPVAVATASLIQTRIGDEDGEKGHRAIHKRLEALGVALEPKVLVPHRTEALAEAVRAVTGEVILILTGSATSDIRDTAPEALRAAGGEVVHFGMPVDPGNLLFLGRLGSKPVIGLPGCARSPALNGVDWVLERVVCGVVVSGADIQAMGVGGLLKEIPERGRPREG